MLHWKSIKDELPPYDTMVFIADKRYILKNGTPLVRINQRTSGSNIKRKENDFIDTGEDFNADYWVMPPKILNTDD